MHRTWFRYAIASFFALLALWPATAGAAVTEQQVQEATDKAVSWFRGQQESDGALGPNGGLDPAWALLGLAGAGVNAADLSTGLGQPSAQDYYLGLWTGPNDKVWTSTGTPQASDYERVILLAKAAGLDPLRLSSEQNLLAKLAGFDKGGFFGLKSTFNQTMFASIVLDQLPVPSWVIEQVAQNIEANAHEDGGYTFSTLENQASYERPGEIDLTGAALAGLCGAGRTAQSPVVAKGIAFLESQRSITTGQIGNVDSTSWALDGLGACGVKRGSSGWTTGDEQTIEWLLSQQLDGGAWASNGIANFYATQDALRALDAPGFDVEPPARLDPDEPLRRAPPTVTAGTLVPVVLAINAGFGSIQLCSTTAPADASLPEVLMAAEAKSSPAGCVSQLEAGAEGVTSLDGAFAQAGSGGGWKVSFDDGSEQDAGDQSVGFGEVVGLRLEDPSSPGEPRGDSNGNGAEREPSGQPEPASGGPGTSAGAPATGPTTTGPTDTGPGAGSAPVLLGVTGLSASRLLLKLGAAGTITVRIAHEVGVGRRRHWQIVKRLTVKATTAGQVTVKLPRIPVGRYRVTVISPGGKSFTGTLTIPTRTARRA